LQRGNERHQSADRIVRALRIGNVALLSRHNEMAIEGSAAADLDRVPERVLIAGLAQDAVVEFLAALGHPFQELWRPIDRNAFLIAGDEEGNRALRLAVMSGEVVEDRRDGAGDAALHVDCATALKLFAGELTLERRASVM